MITDLIPFIHPLELFGVLALTGACLLYAFVLHIKVTALAKRAREQQETFEARIAQVTESIAQNQPAATLPGPALNLTKRGQVLRMRHRGENPETISGALGIPRNEVDLLLKVHHLALDHVDQAG